MIQPIHVNRFLRFSLYSIAGLALLVCFAAAWIQSQAPDPGLTYSRYTGLVMGVDPEGPAAGKIAPGARLYYLNGIPVETFRFPLSWAAGDTLSLVYADGRGLEQTRIEMAQPAFWTIFDRLSPLLAAFVFWIVALVVFARSPFGWLPFFFMASCQVFALTAGLGSLSGYEIAYILPLFQAVAWWVGPLFLHLFLLMLIPGRSKFVIAFPTLYLPVLALSVASFLGMGPFATGWQARLVLDIWTAACFLATTALAAKVYWTETAVEDRRKAGWLVLSSLGGLLPVTLLSMLPEVLTGNSLIRYPVTMLALPLLPLGTSYAIFRSRLVRWENTINRSAAAALAALVIASVYLAVFLALPELLPGKDRQISAFALLVVAGLIAIAQPLYRLLQRGVTRLTYGGWYDERSAVRQISRALDRSEGDGQEVAEALCQALVRTLQLAYVHLLLADGKLVFQELHQSGATCGRISVEVAQRPFTAFRDSENRENGFFPAGEHELSISAEDRLLVLGHQPQMELVLAGRSGPLGLLVLGPRRGGEFEPRDLEILEVVVRQAKVALENARLLEEVRLRSEHINRLHHQLIAAREEERKRVARDLHDQTIQALVGLNYQIARVKKHQNPPLWEELNRLQRDVQLILGEVRQVCADLRPPGLDAMGLVPAIRSRLAVFHTQSTLQVSFFAVEGLEISEANGLCLYRVFQEALTNAHKHARAQHVAVDLSEDERWLTLSIEDDGTGFQLPENLEDLARAQHFGLVGLKEQVEAVGGNLDIRSAPGEGSRLVAKVPRQIEPEKEWA